MEDQDEKTVCGTKTESLKAAARFPSRYECRTLLGEGGMGSVFQAYDLQMKRDVAIKVLSFQGSSLPEIQQRFLKEAKLLASIDHPNIVKLFSAALNDDGNVYQVMEYIEGESLARRLQKEEKLSPEEFKQIFMQVLKGLENLHEKGIVHRDIKPSNIMLSRSAEGELSARIIDLGIARTLGSLDSNTLTQTNAILGSPSYMSPEQCRGQKAEASSDIYSLACIMYECICGKPPFTSDSALETMQKHMYEEPPKLKFNKKNSGAEQLLKLIEQSLQKDGSKRPSCTEIQNALASCRSELILNALDKQDRANSGVKAGLIIAAVLACTVILVFSVGRTRQVNHSNSKSKDEISGGTTGTNKVKKSYRGNLKEINSRIDTLVKKAGKGTLKKDPEFSNLRADLDSIIENAKTEKMIRFVALELKSRLYQLAGEHTSAQLPESEALALCTQAGKTYTEAAKCNANLAQIYFQCKENDKAEAAARKVLQLKEDFRVHGAEQLLSDELEEDLQFITHETARAYGVLASTEAKALHLQKAEHFLEEQKTLIKSYREWQGLANVVTSYSEIYQERNRTADALRIMRNFVNQISKIEPDKNENSFADAFLITAMHLKNLDPDLAKVSCQKGIEWANKLKGTPDTVRDGLNKLLAQLDSKEIK